MANHQTLNEFAEIIERAENSKKRKMILFIIIILLLTTFLIVWGLYSGEKTEDAFLKANNLTGERIEIARLEPKIKEVVTNCISWRENGDTSKLSQISADTLVRFYLLENKSKKFILNSYAEYNKKHPETNFLIDSNFDISKIDVNTYRVFVYGKLVSPKDSVDIVEEIRLDSTLKIFYIRNFYGNRE